MSKVSNYDYKEQLKERYGYTEDFAQDLSIMAESITDYLGTSYEEIVHSSMLSCEYCIAGLKKGTNIYETVLDVAKRNGMIENANTETIELLKRSESAYLSVPHIENDGDNFQIKDTKKLIVLPRTFDSRSPVSLATLAKESLTLVKSSIGEYTIEGSEIVERRGLAEKRTAISINDDGNITFGTQKQIGTGLENALTSYDELSVIRSSYDDSYDTQSYPQGRLIAGYLEQNIGLRDLIWEAQITKNKDELALVFNNTMEISYSEFLSRMDKLEEIERKRFTATPLSNDYHENECVDYIATSIAPAIQEMQKQLNTAEMTASLK